MKNSVDLMTARITATVPNYVADGLKQLSIQQGRDLSKMAAFILEQAVIEKIEAGIIPSEKSMSPKLIQAINSIAQRKGRNSDEVMAFLLEKAIAEGLGEELLSE